MTRICLAPPADVETHSHNKELLPGWIIKPADFMPYYICFIFKKKPYINQICKEQPQNYLLTVTNSCSLTSRTSDLSAEVTGASSPFPELNSLLLLTKATMF